MISVNIATLKAKLSYYLGEVKRGHEVVVMDRSTPVAKLEPIREKRSKLVVRKAKESPKGLLSLKIPPLKPKITVDAAALLREDRDRR